MKKIIMYICLVLVLMPGVAFAQTISTKGIDPSAPGFQLVPCDGVNVQCDYNQAVILASRILTYMLYILAPILVLMILWTGIKYVTAGDNADAIADAKRMFKPIAIGIFFIAAAYLIVYKLILGYLLVDKIGDVSKTQIINAGTSQNQ